MEATCMPRRLQRRRIAHMLLIISTLAEPDSALAPAELSKDSAWMVPGRILDRDACPAAVDGTQDLCRRVAVLEVLGILLPLCGAALELLAHDSTALLGLQHRVAVVVVH